MAAFSHYLNFCYFKWRNLLLDSPLLPLHAGYFPTIADYFTLFGQSCLSMVLLRMGALCIFSFCDLMVVIKTRSYIIYNHATLLPITIQHWPLFCQIVKPQSHPPWWLFIHLIATILKTYLNSSISCAKNHLLSSSLHKCNGIH